MSAVMLVVIAQFSKRMEEKKKKNYNGFAMKTENNKNAKI